MDYEKRVSRILLTIEASNTISPSNKELLESFHRHLLLSGIGPARQQKVMAHLKILAQHVGESSFQDLEKEDIEELVAWLYTRDTTKTTVGDYKQIIKQFWKWMHYGKEPPETAWIQGKHRTHQKLLPQNLLSPDDIEAMLNVVSNERDRAFIALLWETGARIGELLDLRISEIEEDSALSYVIVSGKTGSRRLLLQESGPYLSAWLAVHPNPLPAAFLWCKIDLSQGSPTEQISYQYVRLKILEQAREKANIEKPANPHHFRHSRATYLANYLTEAQLCEWFGWVRGSRIPGRYVHLSGRDIDQAYMTTLSHPNYRRISPDNETMKLEKP